METMENKQSTAELRKAYWKKEEEDLLKSWADKAQCYQWLHMKSRDIYQRKNAFYTIPVIVISTFVGTASFAQDRFSEENRQYLAMGIGSLSIVAGIISTVSQFLKVSELNEAHRIASLSWGKFCRTIKTEISRHPLDRHSPTIVINHNKEEFDRLVEISPPIPKKVMLEFRRKFGDIEDLIRPEVCDELFPTDVFDITDEERENIIQNIVNKTKEAEKKVKYRKSKAHEKEVEDEYKETFFSINGRYPNDFEMKRYMETKSGDILSDSSDETIAMPAGMDSIV